jgi:small subunit ribosomal protein S20
VAPGGVAYPSASPSAPGAGFHPSNSENVTVANIKSQIKRNRQNERLRLKNKSVRSEMRTRTKSAVTAIEAGTENSAEAIRMAVRRIDRAAAKGVIHKNQASNRKSRLMRRAAKAGDQEPVSSKK